MPYGIGITRGYQADLTGQQLYAAIPVPSPLGLIEMARLDPTTGRWTKLSSGIWTLRLATSARPAIAYEPIDNANPSDGRFYLAYNPPGTDGVYIVQTEGNDGGSSATSKRLKWFNPAYASTVSQVADGGISLEYDWSLNRDKNVRAAWTYKGSGLKSMNFFPLADGYVNINMKDQNDYPVITGHLACSLSRSCTL